MQSDRQKEHFSPNLGEFESDPSALQNYPVKSLSTPRCSVRRMPRLMSGNLFDTPAIVLETLYVVVTDDSQREMPPPMSIATPVLLRRHWNRVAN